MLFSSILWSGRNCFAYYSSLHNCLQVLKVFGNTLNGIFSLAQILWPEKMEIMWHSLRGGTYFFLKTSVYIYVTFNRDWMGDKARRALVINGKGQYLLSTYYVPGIAQIYLYIRLNSHNKLHRVGTPSPFYRKGKWVTQIGLLYCSRNLN